MGNATRITGLDSNDGMLRVAQMLWDDRRPLIEWRKGDAAALPFPDQAFDAVFCQQGLQFFPDRLAALKEIRRVLAPGGCLGLTVWRSIQYNAGYQAIANALEQRISRSAAQMERGPFMLDDIGALREMLRQVGFDAIHARIAIHSVRFVSTEELLRQETVSWLGGVIGEISEETRAVLIRDLKTALANYMDDDGLTFPMETYLILAR
jgi:ubiquinone/menaquinone biosynthesis C-methylase UbiE